jgi:hypothetical protein
MVQMGELRRYAHRRAHAAFARDHRHDRRRGGVLAEPRALYAVMALQSSINAHDRHRARLTGAAMIAALVRADLDNPEPAGRRTLLPLGLDGRARARLMRLAGLLHGTEFGSRHQRRSSRRRLVLVKMNAFRHYDFGARARWSIAP